MLLFVPSARRIPRPAALLALSAALLVAAPARDASAEAGVEVTVFGHPGGEALHGVRVVLENPDTSLRAEAETDSRGKARFPALSTAGRYRVSVPESAERYAAESPLLTLRSDFNQSVTLTLVPRATTSEAITVTASTSVARVNAVNAEVSSSLTLEELETLPIEGRDITRALYRLPNVTQATGFYPEAPNVSINGANSLYANYMIDGLDNNENFLGGQKFAQPVGFTQDVTVLTNNYSTEFGRTGNGIFNVTSRSGGNRRSGEVFYLTRPGQPFDSASRFAQRDLSGNQVKDGFERHQLGFALGGPLLADRSFYFVNAELSRDLKDNLLDVPELGVNETVPGRNRVLLLSGRLDHRISPGWTASLRVNQGLVAIERQGGGLEGGISFPSAANAQDRNATLVALKSYVVSETSVWETGAQYGRFRWNYARPEVGGPQALVLGASGRALAELGDPGYVFDSLENAFQLQQKATFHLGRHSLKLGAELLTADFSLAGGGNSSGNYLVQLSAAQEQALAASGIGAGLDVADIPADVQVLDYAVELQPRRFGDRQNLLSFYAEDQIALTSRVDLTLGLRYDYDSLSKGGAARGDLDNLAPRVAFNWMLGDGSVVRGGYGLFYEKLLYAIHSDALQQSSTAQGFRRQLEALIGLGLLPPGTDIDRIVFDGNLTANLGGVAYLQGPGPEALAGQREQLVSGERRVLNPLGYDNPHTHQFALGYQRQLSDRFLFYADLLHARSAALPRLRDLNAPAPFPIDPRDVALRSEAEADATRPVGVEPGGARSIIVTETAGASQYSALSLNLLKDRRDDAWAFRFSYTLSRLENDTEDINFRAQDANHFEAEWGPSINDRRHVVNAIGRVNPLRGLSLSLAALIQSGQPINRIPDARVFGTTDLNGDGRSFGDAYVGNSDRFPGEPRNSDRLPWAWTLDLGVQYAVPAGAGRVELRADVFNLLDRVNLSGFSNNATQSNQIQAGPAGTGFVRRNAAPPRQFQFGVRYLF